MLSTLSIIRPETHLKPGGHGLQPLYLGVLQDRVGGDGGKQLQDLSEATLERVKFPKYVHLAEVELSLQRGLFQLLLGFVEVPLVFLGEREKKQLKKVCCKF